MLLTIQELSTSCHHQECLEACLIALQANSDDVSAYKYAGISLFAIGQLQDAFQFLSKAHLLDKSDPEIIKEIGNYYLSIQNLHEAEKCYMTALSIDPQFVPAINNLGMIAKQQGNIELSKQLIDKALAIDPFFPEALFQSSLILDENNHAQILLNMALKIDTKTLTSSKRAHLEFAKSNCYHKLNHYKMACLSLKMANKYKLLYMPSNAALVLNSILRNTERPFVTC